MHICKYKNIRTRMCMYTHTYTDAYIQLGWCSFITMRMHGGFTYIFLCTQTHTVGTATVLTSACVTRICMYIYIYTIYYIYIHAFIHTYIHTYIHICIQTHTHMQLEWRRFVPVRVQRWILRRRTDVPRRGRVLHIHSSGHIHGARPRVQGLPIHVGSGVCVPAAQPLLFRVLGVLPYV
jgi:hypothetical protein